VQRRLPLLLLPILAGAMLIAPAREADAQEVLRGTLPDTPVDTPKPRKARAGAEPDEARGVYRLEGADQIKLDSSLALRPNRAVRQPGPGVAPGIMLDTPRPPARRRNDDPYQPLGLRLGNLNLSLSNEIQAGYDDNTQSAGAGRAKRPSSFVREGAELHLRSDWSRHELTGDLAGGYSWYPNAHEANRPDLNARIGLRLDMARDTEIRLETRGQVSSQNLSSPDIRNVSAARRPLAYTYGATVGVTQRYNRLVFALSGNVDRQTYDNIATTSGTTFNQSDRNETAFGVTLRGGYELKPGLMPFVEGTIDTRRYDQTLDNSGFQRSSDGVSARLGTTFEITRLLTGEISAGYGTRSYDDARLAALSGPIANAGIKWAVTPLLTANLKASSSFDETTLLGSSGALTHRVSFDLRHQLLRNLALGAGISYSTSHYDGVDRRDDNIAGTLNAEYKLNRTLSGRFAYTYTRGLSNVIGEGYTSSVWLLGLKASL
jgi:hypothetical protein